MTKPESYSVGTYLGLANKSLLALRAVVHGEVTSVDFRGNYLFFKLRDEHDDAILPCFMWMRAFESSGVALAEGMKVAALGVPEIFKARGSFTFQAARVEEIGEGALKKRYDELRKKLEQEGVFSPERKRALPSFPQTIGLVTSSTGAVIHDFRNNLGKRGIRILFHDTRVEGLFAEADIVKAIRHFHSSPAELVVVIRGGGSLESLAAFNSEAVVREIAALPVPVICGIGHDKDVPLAALAADFSVSTPTAAAELINRLFVSSERELQSLEAGIVGSGTALFSDAHAKILFKAQSLESNAQRIFERGRAIEARFHNASVSFERQLRNFEEKLRKNSEDLSRGFSGTLRTALSRIVRAEDLLEARDPQKVLELGYSIIRGSRGIIRKASDAKVGDSVALRVSDGTMSAKITEILWQQKKDSRKI